VKRAVGGIGARVMTARGTSRNAHAVVRAHRRVDAMTQQSSATGDAQNQ
jgi:hypothetical protein